MAILGLNDVIDQLKKVGFSEIPGGLGFSSGDIKQSEFPQKILASILDSAKFCYRINNSFDPATNSYDGITYQVQVLQGEKDFLEDHQKARDFVIKKRGEFKTVDTTVDPEGIEAWKRGMST
jgi:hypothetical protein